MTKTINKTLKAALVLGITLGTAGGLTAITTPMTATQAQAFGLGDITGAAKKVGGAVKDGAKFVGKAGVEMGKHAGKTAVRTAQGVRDASLSAAGRVTYAPTAVLAPLYFRATGQWNEKNRQILEDMERDWVDAFDNAGDKMDRGIRRVGQATGEFVRTGGVTSGESLSREPSPEAKCRLQNGLRDFANGGGLNRSVNTGLARGGAFYNGRQGLTRKGAKTPILGITKENLNPSTGQTMKISLPKGQLGNVAFKGNKGAKNNVVRKGTNFRNTVVGDRSLTGRPIGLTLDGKALPRQGSRPNQRPRPITANDIKPSFCNSKFQNCSGNHGGHGKKGKKNGSRDRSVSGNPVGNNKKARSNRYDDRRVQINRHDNRGQAKNRSNKRFSGGNKQRHVRKFNGGSSRQLKIRR